MSGKTVSVEIDADQFSISHAFGREMLGYIALHILDNGQTKAFAHLCSEEMGQ